MTVDEQVTSMVLTCWEEEHEHFVGEGVSDEVESVTMLSDCVSARVAY